MASTLNSSLSLINKPDYEVLKAGDLKQVVSALNSVITQINILNASAGLVVADTINEYTPSNGTTIPNLSTLIHTTKGNAATGYGLLSLKTLTNTVNLTTTQTVIIPMGIPSGAFVVATSIRNNTLIQANSGSFTTYDSDYVDQTLTKVAELSDTIPVAQNTKTDIFTTTLVIGATTIDVQVDCGIGNTFKASDSITVVTYYYQITSLTSV